jgi:protein-S-isoprenylcysteine O-methyltransferase Ste14
MTKSLTNCSPNVPQAIASPPIRLLLSRVVALLVFAVSPAIPARWSGRRWVGPVVVTIVGAVGGLALLWVWLWLVLSTNMRHIKEMRELIV